mmetsp:Transcript_6853/g.17119  ORF Transcript_6853/g.17119 Transcript_6853/m.17119 type:complete len:207 (+) Transcript_6853:1066-1686(+)
MGRRCIAIQRGICKTSAMFRIRTVRSAVPGGMWTRAWSRWRRVPCRSASCRRLPHSLGLPAPPHQNHPSPSWMRRLLVPAVSLANAHQKAPIAAVPRRHVTAPTSNSQQELLHTCRLSRASRAAGVWRRRSAPSSSVARASSQAPPHWALEAVEALPQPSRTRRGGVFEARQWRRPCKAGATGARPATVGQHQSAPWPQSTCHGLT